MANAMACFTNILRLRGRSYVTRLRTNLRASGNEDTEKVHRWLGRAYHI